MCLHDFDDSKTGGGGGERWAFAWCRKLLVHNNRPLGAYHANIIHYMYSAWWSPMGACTHCVYTSSCVLAQPSEHKKKLSGRSLHTGVAAGPTPEWFLRRRGPGETRGRGFVDPFGLRSGPQLLLTTNE